MLSYDLGLTPRSVWSMLSLTLSSLCVTSRELACFADGRWREKDLYKTTEKTQGIFLYIFFTLDRLNETVRVLNNLHRARLSRGRMIWLLAHPLLPSPVSRATHRKTRKRDKKYWRERGVRGWAKSQIILLHESLVLYKSFNTLSTPSSLAFHAIVLCSDSMIILARSRLHNLPN
jgi:hypothetical protein